MGELASEGNVPSGIFRLVTDCVCPILVFIKTGLPGLENLNLYAAFSRFFLSSWPELFSWRPTVASQEPPNLLTFYTHTHIITLHHSTSQLFILLKLWRVERISPRSIIHRHLPHRLGPSQSLASRSVSSSSAATLRPRTRRPRTVPDMERTCPRGTARSRPSIPATGPRRDYFRCKWDGTWAISRAKRRLFSIIYSYCHYYI